MLDAVRHDDELALVDRHVAVAEAHEEPALHDQEQLVLCLVMMPDKLTLDLHQFEVRIIYLSGDARLPVVADQAELLREIHDIGHSALLDHDVALYLHTIAFNRT